MTSVIRIALNYASGYTLVLYAQCKQKRYSLFGDMSLLQMVTISFAVTACVKMTNELYSTVTCCLPPPLFPHFMLRSAVQGSVPPLPPGMPPPPPPPTPGMPPLPPGSTPPNVPGQWPSGGPPPPPPGGMMSQGMRPPPPPGYGGGGGYAPHMQPPPPPMPSSHQQMMGRGLPPPPHGMGGHGMGMPMGMGMPSRVRRARFGIGGCPIEG